MQLIIFLFRIEKGKLFATIPGIARLTFGIAHVSTVDDFALCLLKIEFIEANSFSLFNQKKLDNIGRINKQMIDNNQEDYAVGLGELKKIIGVSAMNSIVGIVLSPYSYLLIYINRVKLS